MDCVICKNGFVSDGHVTVTLQRVIASSCKKSDFVLVGSLCSVSLHFPSGLG